MDKPELRIGQSVAVKDDDGQTMLGVVTRGLYSSRGWEYIVRISEFNDEIFTYDQIDVAF